MEIILVWLSYREITFRKGRDHMSSTERPVVNKETLQWEGNPQDFPVEPQYQPLWVMYNHFELMAALAAEGNQ